MNGKKRAYHWCQNAAHKIEICQEFVKKLVVGRTQFIIRKGLCFPVYMMTVGAAPKLHMKQIRFSSKHYRIVRRMSMLITYNAVKMQQGNVEAFVPSKDSIWVKISAYSSQCGCRV